MIPAVQPGQNPIMLKCEKICTVFHFDNMETLKETLMGHDTAALERDRSSFRFSVAKPVTKALSKDKSEEESKGSDNLHEH